MKERIGFRLLIVESKKTSEGYTILVTYKSTRKTTDFRCQKSYWNPKKRRLNTNAPMALSVNAELEKLQNEYEAALDEINAENPTIHNLYQYIIEKK